jgi:hypothetical protein
MVGDEMGGDQTRNDAGSASGSRAGGQAHGQ